MKRITQLKSPCGEIQNANTLFDKIRSIHIDYTQENVMVFYLNTPLQVTNHEILFKGGIDTSIICPHTLFRKALLNNASAIILAHNHPSGNLHPSDEDLMVFKQLKKAGKLIGITVCDQIIFNKNQYYSCNDHE